MKERLLRTIPNLNRIYSCVLFAVILLTLGHMTTYGQGMKDETQFSELEEKARKEFDKSLSKFQNDVTKKKGLRPEADTLPAVSQPSSSYDKFKDSTTVSISSPVYHRITPPFTGAVGKFSSQVSDTDQIATYVHTGQEYTRPEQYILTFKTFSNDAFFGRSPSIIVLGDSTRFRLGNMTQSLDRYERTTYEYVSIAIPSETFLKIVNSDKVEVQVENFDFPLSTHNLNSLRRLSGQPEKELILPTTVSSPKVDTTMLGVSNTIWASKDGGTIRFMGDGSLLATGAGRGRWSQKGDVVKFEFPDAKLGTVRIGIGIIRGEYMVNRYRVKALFGKGVISAEVLKLEGQIPLIN